MRIFKFITGSLATIVIGASAFSQQPNQVQPNQVQPNQVQPRQTPPSSGQTIPGQLNQGQAGQPRSTQGQQAGTPSGATHSSNDVLAACLAIENQEEIQIAQFAKDKASNNEVKEFASMLVEEHKKFLESIRKTAPNTTQLSALKGDATQQNQNQTTPYRTASSQTQVGASGSTIDVVQLHRELAEQCLVDSKEKLTQKSDDEFDKCFVGMQIAKHAGMQTKLTVLQRHATGELKNVISEGLETTKKHMKHAEKLMDQLADTGSSNRKRKKDKE